MKYSRRDWSFLMPLCAAAVASGQNKTLPSKTFRFEDLKAEGAGPNRRRAVLDGETHTGYPIEVHETELAPGLAPHPPHKHAHVEMLVVHLGTLEVTISGATSRVGPGSVVYVASNEEHGWKNVGDGRANYVVFALGRGKS